MTIISSHETDFEGGREEEGALDEDDLPRALPLGGLGLLDRDSVERMGLFSNAWKSMMRL